MKHIFILNPAAGKGNKLDRFEQTLRAAAKERGISYELYYTGAAGDASRFVHEYCLKDTESPLRFYACGGDGTINEVVSGAVGFENVQVAVVPIGTGNDFVRFHGSRDAFLDIVAQIDSDAVSTDLIRWNDKYCVNMINIGFDGEVAARARRAKRYLPGSLAYICGVLGEFFKMSKANFRCTIDGRVLGERSVQLSVYANGGFCGGGFFAAPYADLHDGMLDVCFIRPVSRLTLLKLIGSYRKGTYLLGKDAEKYFEYFKCSEIKLDFDKPQRVCVDGEIEECDSLQISVLRDAVRMVIPTGADPEREEMPASPYVKTPL